MEVVGKDSVALERNVTDKLTADFNISEVNLLDKPYDIKVVPGEKEYIVGVDGGSTGTRPKFVELVEGKVVDLAVLTTIDYHEIPSDVIIQKSVEGITGFNSNNLSDQLVSKLINKDMNDFLPSSFLIRGSVMEALNGPVSSIGSTGSKVRNGVYYYNIIDSIGYGLIMETEGLVPSSIKIHLAVSLPPEDENVTDVEFLKKNLNKFIWQHSSGAEIAMEFVAHYVITEPQAQDIALRMQYADEELDRRRKGCVHTIEGGGRSIGNNITRNGLSIKEGKKTLDYGAKFIEDELITALRSMFPHKVNRSAIKEAVHTGEVRIGKSQTINVVNILISIKTSIADRMAIDIKRDCYDPQRVVLPSDVTDIVMSGGLFRRGLYDFSIAEPLAEKLFQFIPNAEFDIITENNIPQGLVLYAVSKMGLSGKSTPSFSAGFASSFTSKLSNAEAQATIQAEEEVKQALSEAAAANEVPAVPAQLTGAFGQGLDQPEAQTPSEAQSSSDSNGTI